jgi:hypothetical protein
VWKSPATTFESQFDGLFGIQAPSLVKTKPGLEGGAQTAASGVSQFVLQRFHEKHRCGGLGAPNLILLAVKAAQR